MIEVEKKVEEKDTEKKYIVHSGWLGKSKVEVEVIEVYNEKAVVKAIEGFPFDMWHENSSIPSTARCTFYMDTYWYDSKIIPISQLITENNDC